MLVECPSFNRLLYLQVHSNPGPHDIDDEEPKSEEDLCTKLSPEHLHRLYVFSLVWGMGAFLELQGRIKFDAFLRDKLSTLLDLPQAPGDPGTTVFDFYVNDEGEDY